MNTVGTKSSLAVVLSRLSTFEHSHTYAEQYPTDSEVGASVLWNAYMNSDIKGKIIADLGAGTGIIGIGCLLLGAKKVYFVDSDSDALEIAKKNLDTVDKTLAKKAVFIAADIKEFNEHVDVVVMNPPFGTKNIHADKIFLEQAFKIAPVVFSFHKVESEKFLDSFSRDSGYTITHKWPYDFPIKQTMAFHTKKIYRFKVVAVRLAKNRVQSS